jgi:hypothetical protein
MKKYTLILSILLFASLVHAQNFPGPGNVFKDDEVPRVNILIHPDSLDKIYDDLEKDYEYHAAFVFQNSNVPHDTLLNIGFRLRGNTSLFSAKKSFKVSFNTYVPGRKYDNLEKLNLNGEHNDPGIIRSKLCWDLFRKFGIPAPRAAHTEVYINGDYYGLYINVEHIDDQFVKTSFGNNNGNLYKCLWPADLQYLGSDPDLYKFGSGGQRTYELQTNTDIDDYSDLAHFIDVLNNTPADSLKEKLDPVFNVQTYLKYLVIEALTGHWDAYSFNKNNYYLYHNLNTGKFEFIPYDMDNTFGIDWMNIDWAHRDIYNMASDDPRPLTKRLLANDLYRKEFSFYMDQFLRECFNVQQLYGRIDSLYFMIYPYASADPYRPLDYGWTMQDFTQSYVQSLGGHVKYGLKPFINTRYSSAMQQLVLAPTPKLFINEFMATNSSVIADEFGEYDDWIEIYNGAGSPVWLGDKYLSDNLSQPSKWALPQLTLNAGDYLLIWADNDLGQGSKHAGFKLSAEGEQIGIFTSPASGSLPIDILTYGQQITDISSGLLPNGDGMIQLLAAATPGGSNMGNIGIGENELSVNIHVYPNPFTDIFNISLFELPGSTHARIVATDILGRPAFDNDYRIQPGQDIIVRPGELLPGMYLLSAYMYNENGLLKGVINLKLVKK